MAISFKIKIMVVVLVGIFISSLPSGVLADGQVALDTSSFAGYHISSKSEWEELKTQVRLDPEIRALSPNFAKSAVILAYWGEKPSAGFDVDITEFAVQGETAVVMVKFTSPQKDAVTASVITYPADAKVIDSSEMAKVTKILFRAEGGDTVAELKVTPRQAYTVQVGDTLWKIAKTLGRRAQGQIMDFVHQVVVWNNLNQGNTLIPGQKLAVPGNMGTEDPWQLEQAAFSALGSIDKEGAVGFGLNPDSTAWVLTASARMTALRQATIRLGVPTKVLDSQNVAIYTSTGPWVRNASNEIIADVRAVVGASVVNFLSLSPDGQFLAVGARGYENLLLIWDCVNGRFMEVERYPNEVVSRVVWSSDSQMIAVELAGAWGRSRLVGYGVDGSHLDWSLEKRWPAGYNLVKARWLGMMPVLSFEVEAVGLSATAGELTGEWVFDPSNNTVRPAQSGIGLL